MENKKTISKGIIIAIAAAVVLVAVGIAAFFVFKEKTYRIVKIFEVEGKTIVTRDKKGDIDAYQNMILESGDTVYVQQGKTVLKLDDDKFVYAEETSKFSLVAKGNKKDSKTSINLIEGAITNDIQNKLSNNSSYEINTQNSNMAVKGTTYRVHTYIGDDGVLYTKVSVFGGAVSTRLIYSDGTVSDEEVMVENGKEVIIYENDVETDYLSEPKDIDYSDLPADVLEILIDKLKNGEIELDISIEELQDIYDYIIENGSHTVTFMYGGTVFGTQSVEHEGYATVPGLVPAQSGNWDYDFNEPVTEDIVIEWK